MWLSINSTVNLTKQTDTTWTSFTCSSYLSLQERHFLLQLFDHAVSLLDHHARVLELKTGKHTKSEQSLHKYGHGESVFALQTFTNAPLTCSIMCLTFLCWLFSMSSRWWIFSLRIATSFSNCSALKRPNTNTSYINCDLTLQLLTFGDVCVYLLTCGLLSGPPLWACAARGAPPRGCGLPLAGWRSPVPSHPATSGAPRCACLSSHQLPLWSSASPPGHSDTPSACCLQPGGRTDSSVCGFSRNL